MERLAFCTVSIRLTFQMAYLRRETVTSMFSNSASHRQGPLAALVYASSRLAEATRCWLPLWLKATKRLRRQGKAVKDRLLRALDLLTGVLLSSSCC